MKVIFLLVATANIWFNTWCFLNVMKRPEPNTAVAAAFIALAAYTIIISIKRIS